MGLQKFRRRGGYAECSGHHVGIIFTSGLRWESILSNSVGLLVCWCIRKHRFSPLNRIPILSTSWDLSTAILDFQLPVWYEIILSSSIRLLDPKNIGLAIEIAFQSCPRYNMESLGCVYTPLAGLIIDSLIVLILHSFISFWHNVGVQCECRQWL